MTSLLAAGASVPGVATVLGMDRKTVQRWSRRIGPPLWLKPPQPTALDPHRAYFEQRWQEGSRNAAALARELILQGADIRPTCVTEP